MNKSQKISTNREKTNKIAFFVELALTVTVCILVIFAGISDMRNTVAETAYEIDSDYETLVDSYLTTFNIISSMVEEKIQEDVTADEMMEWLQSKDDTWKNAIGADIYDGFALIYKGEYVRSWKYGEYSDYDVTTRPWYQQAYAAGGETVVVAPYVTFLDSSELGDEDITRLSIARKYNNEIVFDYDIKIKEIRNLLSDRTIKYEDSKMMLFDPYGYILSSSDESEYAHNIATPDEVISQELSKTILDSRMEPKHLLLKQIDGKVYILYTVKTSQENTFCVMFSLWEAITHHFLIVVIVALFLIALELYIYRTNKKSIQEFANRDKRLSVISEVAYKVHIYVDIATMTFQGSDEIQKRIGNNNYEAAYQLFYEFAADAKSAKKMQEFLSSKVLKQESYYAENVNSQLFELSIIHDDATREQLIYEVYKICSIIDGKKVATILCNDVTEDTQRLKEALHTAKAASKAKTEFLSRMSHDIRTPMNAIVGMTHLAKEEDDIMVVREYLENIGSSSKFLLGLINDILDLSKIESGKLTLKQEPYTREEFENAVNTIIRPLMTAKKIQFECTMDKGAECIMVDRLRFNQIFFNLLSNAAKFTPRGGKVEFIIEKLPKRNGIYGARYTVRDNGIGMSKEFLPHIYESFVQERSERSGQSTGTGLGLPIVKNLVDAMTGTIRVHSTEGIGTEFVIDLYTPEIENTRSLTKEDLEEISLGGREILIAEDNDMNIMVVTKILEKKGCCLTVVKDGRQAVMAFDKSAEGFFDAILMDVRMPILDGIQATKEIRKLNRSDATRIPIIAMTADAFVEEQKKTMAAGMNYHMTKPIEPLKLYQILQKYIARYRDVE